MSKRLPLGVMAVAALALGVSGGAWASASTHNGAPGAAHSSSSTSTHNTNKNASATGPDPADARGPVGDPPAPTFKLGGGGTLTIQGFVGFDAFVQDQPYAIGNGSTAQFPIPVSSTQLNATGRITGADVRDTRMQFIFSHPLANGWDAGGFMSFDWYGGFNGDGIVSGQQPNPRLRLAFVSLKKGANSFKFGQIPSLEETEFPYSLAHMIFPLGFFMSAGGWRYPGVGAYHVMSMGNGSHLSLSGQILEGNFPNGVQSTTNWETGGNAGFQPQYEGRVDWTGKTMGGTPYSLFIIGNYQKVHITGAFGLPLGYTPPENSFTSYNIIVGGSFNPGKFRLRGEIFTDKAQANELYDFIQVGDIKNHGGWIQAGYQLPAHWNVYAGYYYASPNSTDVQTWGGHYLKGQATSVSLNYDVGTFATGLEWIHNIQRYVNGGAESTIVANQINLAVVYRF